MKNNAIDLSVTPNTVGYTIGGGIVSQSNLTITGSNITMYGSGSATLTFPTTSQIIAGLSSYNEFQVSQVISGSLDLEQYIDMDFTSSMPTPDAGHARISYDKRAGLPVLRVKDAYGNDTHYQRAFSVNGIQLVTPGVTGLVSGSGAWITSGSVTLPAVTEYYGTNANFIPTATGSGGGVGIFTTNNQFYRGTMGPNRNNGFYMHTRIMFPSSSLASGSQGSNVLAAYSNQRTFIGFSNATPSFNAMTNNATGTPTGDYCGFMFRSGTTGIIDTAWQFVGCNGGTSATSASTTFDFASHCGNIMDFYIYAPPYPSTGSVYWRIEDNTTGVFVESSSQTSSVLFLPSPAQALRAGVHMSNSGSGGPVGWAVSSSGFLLNRIYVETDK